MLVEGLHDSTTGCLDILVHSNFGDLDDLANALLLKGTVSFCPKAKEKAGHNVISTRRCVP